MNRPGSHSPTATAAAADQFDPQERPEVLENMKMAGLKVALKRDTDTALREAFQHLPWYAIWQLNGVGHWNVVPLSKHMLCDA